MPSPPTGYIHLEDGTYENIWLDIAMGVITLGGAGLLAWFFRGGITMDVNSPDFNPVTFALPLAAAYGIFLLGRSLYKRSRSSRWGKSILEIESKGPQMGKVFSPRIFCGSVRKTEGDLEITLRFVETFDFRDRGSTIPVLQENIRWQETVLVNGSLRKLEDGVRAEFRLPTRDLLKRDKNAKASAKAALAVNIPGIETGVIAHNVLPDSVRWVLEIAAAVQGAKYSASWGIRVSESFPVKSGA